MSFAVVQFAEDDGGSVSIVNTHWLTPRKSEVFWPPIKGSKAFEKVLKANTTPDDKTWKLYGVKRVFCQTDALEEAKKKLKLSEITSDIDSVPEEPQQPSKRPLNRTKRFISDTSCSSNDENLIRPPSLKKTELKKVAAKLAETVTENVLDEKQTSNSIEIEYIDESINADLPSGLLQDLEVQLGMGQQFDILEKSNTCSSILMEYQSKVISLLATIKTQNTQILEILKQTYINARPKGTLPDVFQFPLKTGKDLYNNEELLKNKSLFEDLVSYLKTFGGQDYKSKTRRILKYLISDSLACIYNFYGQKRAANQKKPFNKLILLKCIIESVITTTNNVSAKEIEDSVKNWAPTAYEADGRRHHFELHY